MIVAVRFPEGMCNVFPQDLLEDHGQVVNEFRRLSLLGYASKRREKQVVP